MSSPLQDGSIATNDVIEAVHINQLFPILADLEDGKAFFRPDQGSVNAYQVGDTSVGVFIRTHLIATITMAAVSQRDGESQLSQSVRSATSFHGILDQRICLFRPST
jgi:hypothetical protein